MLATCGYGTRQGQIISDSYVKVCRLSNEAFLELVVAVMSIMRAVTGRLPGKPFHSSGWTVQDTLSVCITVMDNKPPLPELYAWRGET